MSRPQKYNPSLGMQGNLEESLWQIQYRQNEIQNNKSLQDNVNAETENVLCELDSIDRIAEIEEALCELDERLGGTL